MKLKDCTKDELIYLIQRRGFLFGDTDIQLDILLFRQQRLIAESDSVFSKAQDELTTYIELMSPYEGKPMASIPIGVIRKASEAMKRRMAHMKRYEVLEARYKKISIQTDKMLEIGAE